MFIKINNIWINPNKIKAIIYDKQLCEISAWYGQFYAFFDDPNGCAGEITQESLELADCTGLKEEEIQELLDKIVEEINMKISDKP